VNRTPTPTRMRPQTLMLLSTAAATVLAAAACSRCSAPAAPHDPPAPAEPKPGDPLLQVDGITITFGDVLPMVEFFDTLSREGSRRTKMQRVIEEYTLPLLFARREFQEERKKELAQATGLRAVAGNVLELEEKSTAFRRKRERVRPREVEIPIARFLFDKLHQGAVSDPIELPQGYTVVGSFELVEAQLLFDDQCDALQVTFYTPQLHDDQSYHLWLRALQKRLDKKVTWYHPDYRDAVPSWLLP
jgi:hypothetical protein